jgi:hypothetical protein
MVSWATEIVLRAERKAGAMLAEVVPHQGGRPKKGNGGMLPLLAVTKEESKRWQRVAAVPERVFERYVTETREAGRPLTASAVRKVPVCRDECIISATIVQRGRARVMTMSIFGSDMVDPAAEAAHFAKLVPASSGLSIRT